jgi:regulator of nucleoside diphosphate kinase
MVYMHLMEAEMEQRPIVLNREDYTRLKGLVETFKRTRKMSLPHYKRLETELKSARIIDNGPMPEGVVTIGSRVEYTLLPSGRKSTAVLVFPAQVGDSEQNISVTSPLGLALMGEIEETEVVYTAPGGEFTVRIDRVSHG